MTIDELPSVDTNIQERKKKKIWKKIHRFMYYVYRVCVVLFVQLVLWPVG